MERRLMYAHLSADLQTVKTWDALADEGYALLLAAGNPKTLRYRLQVVDPAPTITATQTYGFAGFVMTEQELAQVDARAEREQIADRLGKLAEAIDAFQALLDVPYSEPAQAGSTALELTALRQRMRVVERAHRDVLREAILTMKSLRGELKQTKQAL
jgi:hypothetical protein